MQPVVAGILALTTLVPVTAAGLGWWMLRRGVARTWLPAVIAAVLLRSLSVVVAANALHLSTSNSTLGRYLLDPSSSYFRTQVRYLLYAEASAVAFCLLLWGFLQLLRTRRPETMEPGEPLLVSAVLLLLGWPNLLFGLAATLLVAVFGSIVLAASRRSLQHRIRLGVCAVTAVFLTAALHSAFPAAFAVLDRLRL